jgi:hypothetical protein
MLIAFPVGPKIAPRSTVISIVAKAAMNVKGMQAGSVESARNTIALVFWRFRRILAANPFLLTLRMIAHS